MSEEIIPSEPHASTGALVPASQPVVLKEGGNVAVTALVPEDMSVCHQALIEWCQRKVSELTSDAKELRGAYQHALDKKWKSATFLRHAQKVERRITFYEKVSAALQHGYMIVPNFPVQAFAIRTDKMNPLRLLTTSDSWNTDCKQRDGGLDAGDGGYENPFPILASKKVTSESDPNKTHREIWAKEWDDLEFPISMSKPQIMEATTRAMALCIFDDIGILPAARKEDPVILGRVHLRNANSNSQIDQTVSFMIAWHLDTRVL